MAATYSFQKSESDDEELDDFTSDTRDSSLPSKLPKRALGSKVPPSSAPPLTRRDPERQRAEITPRNQPGRTSQANDRHLPSSSQPTSSKPIYISSDDELEFKTQPSISRRKVPAARPDSTPSEPQRDFQATTASSSTTIHGKIASKLTLRHVTKSLPGQIQFTKDKSDMEPALAKVSAQKQETSRKFERQKTENSRVKKEKVTLSEKEPEGQANIAEAKAKRDASTKMLKEKDAKLRKEQELNRVLTLKLDQSSSNLTRKESDITVLKDKVAKRNQRLEDLQKALASKPQESKERISQLSLDKADLEEEIQKCHATIAELQAEHSKSNREGSKPPAGQQVHDDESLLPAEESKMSPQNPALGEDADALSELRAENARLIEKNMQLTSQFKEKRAQFLQVSTEQKQAIDDRTLLRDTVSKMSSENAKFKEEVRTYCGRLGEVRAEKLAQSLQALAEQKQSIDHLAVLKKTVSKLKSENTKLKDDSGANCARLEVLLGKERTQVLQCSAELKLSIDDRQLLRDTVYKLTSENGKLMEDTHTYCTKLRAMQKEKVNLTQENQRLSSLVKEGVTEAAEAQQAEWEDERTELSEMFNKLETENKKLDMDARKYCLMLGNVRAKNSKLEKESSGLPAQAKSTGSLVTQKIQALKDRLAEASGPIDAPSASMNDSTNVRAQKRPFNLTADNRHTPRKRILRSSAHYEAEQSYQRLCEQLSLRLGQVKLKFSFPRGNSSITNPTVEEIVVALTTMLVQKDGARRLENIISHTPGPKFRCLSSSFQYEAGDTERLTDIGVCNCDQVLPQVALDDKCLEFRVLNGGIIEFNLSPLPALPGNGK